MTENDLKLITQRSREEDSKALFDEYWKNGK